MKGLEDIWACYIPSITHFSVSPDNTLRSLELYLHLQYSDIYNINNILKFQLYTELVALSLSK